MSNLPSGNGHGYHPYYHNQYFPYAPSQGNLRYGMNRSMHHPYSHYCMNPFVHYHPYPIYPIPRFPYPILGGINPPYPQPSYSPYPGMYPPAVPFFPPYHTPEISMPMPVPMVYPSSSTEINPSVQSANPGSSQNPSPQNVGVSENQPIPQEKTIRRQTIIAASSFNPKQDARLLERAINGFKKNEKNIIDVLGRRSNLQRQDIVQMYRTIYKKELAKDLRDEMTGKFRDLVIALVNSLPDFYVYELHRTINAFNLDESALVEVLCSLKNSDICFIKLVYEKHYGFSLDEDLKLVMSGNFGRLMVHLCTFGRDETEDVNAIQAKNDAQILFLAGSLRSAAEHGTFINILSTRNYAQLKAIFAEYENLRGLSIENTVKNDFFGIERDGILSVVRCIKNRYDYFSECLYNSVAGPTPDYRTFIRLIVTRSENDLGCIKLAFEKMYGKSIKSLFENDDCDDYKRLLSLLADC